MQERTDAHFDDAARYWRDVYDGEDLAASIYGRRQDLALRWVDGLELSTGAGVLDVGCGAGLATVELARRGFVVHAIDPSTEMVREASRRVVEADLGGTVTVTNADVHLLPFPAATFSLAVALGVLPWLHSPVQAITELARVLVPGGHLVLTADNRQRLNRLVEPAENPLLAPLRDAWRGFQSVRGNPPHLPLSHLHRPGTVDQMLVTAGLEPVRRTSLGFGPFTFRWKPILSDQTGLALDRVLERWADGPVSPLRRWGWHYVVLARRPAAYSPARSCRLR